MVYSFANDIVFILMIALCKLIHMQFCDVALLTFPEKQKRAAFSFILLYNLYKELFLIYS